MNSRESRVMIAERFYAAYANDKSLCFLIVKTLSIFFGGESFIFFMHRSFINLLMFSQAMLNEQTFRRPIDFDSIANIWVKEISLF